MSAPPHTWYSRLIVRHHWLVLACVLFICIALTIIGLVFTQFPDFSDPRIGWGARGKGTIFSQLMVLRHASEKFRLAYEIPLDTNELFGAFDQFLNVTVEKLDESSYRSDLLSKHDVWRKKRPGLDVDEVYDYRDLNDTFYDTDLDENEVSDYDEDAKSPSELLFQWHRDRHYDVKNLITKYVDDKMINITVLEFVRNLPQFNKTNYQGNRFSVELLRPYAYLLEEKYRGRAGRDGMIEFYFERTRVTDDLLSLDHLLSICRWEKKFKHILGLDDTPSLSLATFVALYASKNDCQLITAQDIEHFRSVLHTCLPYYVGGYMDVPLSDQFLNRVTIEHGPGSYTHQEQTKAIYAALRHICFYKNVTRLIFDHFVDKSFLSDFQQSKHCSKVSLSMIYITNYKEIHYNRTRDQTMCLRRKPHSIKYCAERGCFDDYRNNFIDKSCANQESFLTHCAQYCECKYQCLNETEEVVLLIPILKAPELIQIYRKNFAGKRHLSTYQDDSIKLIALNLANAREKTAMAQIHDDMLLVTIAAVLIIGITVCYLRSISIALIIVIGAALSIGVSYFIYRTIYRIPIFPFMNLMSAFILIGIGCDDIFVFFDTWDQEKVEWLRKYQEKQHNDNTDVLLNNHNNHTNGNINNNNNNCHELVPSHQKVKPSRIKRPSRAFQSRHHLSPFNNAAEIRKLILREDALIEIMSNTLKHAASSMFVTSFTTAAAFFTNMLTNISFVQVFGVFTGTCILIYFVITVTAIAAFAVIYEKYIQNAASRLLSICSTSSDNTTSKSSIKIFCRAFASNCTNFRNWLFTDTIPLIILNLRYIFVPVFLFLGILGLVGIFHYPKLQVPSTQKVAFFLRDNPMEIYEFSMKTKFNGYSKEDRRLFAYPAVSFIFGIRDVDDGHIFDMTDRGNLYLMPIDLNKKITLDFIKQFIAHLGTRNDLFASNYDLEKDFESFYQLTTDNIVLAKVADDRARLNVSKTGHLAMVKYLRKLNITFIDQLVLDTVRTQGYNIQNDQSDQDYYIDRKLDPIDQNLYKMSLNELKSAKRLIINYVNYRKLFNKTLERYYKEQIEQSYDMNEIRNSLNSTMRDALTGEYQSSALKTAMQCLTGAAGANNIPADFCDKQLHMQRSVYWAVLPDKPSSVDGSIRPFAVIITIRGAFNRTDYDAYNKYYMKVKNFFDPYIKEYAPEHLKHAWFSSPGFAFYGIQRELLVGSYSSLIASLGIALLVLFLTSGNLFIAIYALITITFAIAATVGIFAVLEWELGIVEAIIVIMSVGLSVDFVVHFGVGYIHTDHKDVENERENVRNHYLVQTNELDESEHHYKISDFRLRLKEHQVERETRVTESVSRVGSAVFMAAFTTFAAGFSMTLSSLCAFRQMGQFLMTIMFTSWSFAMFFFLPLCVIIGPVGSFGSIPFKKIFKCCN